MRSKPRGPLAAEVAELLKVKANGYAVLVLKVPAGKSIESIPVTISVATIVLVVTGAVVPPA
jgi:hypothetical protein